MKGTVKWFSDDKGYGFISPEDGSADVFVHFSSILSADKRKNLADGDRVEFKIVPGAKGPAAEEVIKL